MASASPMPIEAETLVASVGPRGVQTGSLTATCSVGPRGVQTGTGGFGRSFSETPVAPRGVQAERRDPDEAERADLEGASRLDCALEREADDWLRDFLPTTVTVSNPSSLSPTAPCWLWAAGAAGRAVVLVSPSPLLLLPDVVSGQAEGGANVMSDPDIVFAASGTADPRRYG